ncbi:hypothetical protein D8674_020191 [Pyrus ussuriensis x Pyrus communis]|uniref:Reverse transcriptase/retrotransposon-derived protein RNase H-like domain-containing protein n=1 Tax=Pyrus ussuriensis x Pyrus communis TaxID=2448454 RepID=A0A5N5HJ22_9ROSA|nr:hypothetical protein D8674_020191 [Pyrus ussuriensis x Pyrus communis]
MSGLDPNLVCHTLNTQHGIKAVVQPRRNFHLEIEAKIKVEVEKLLATRFIKLIKHPLWLANIVLVNKKNIVQFRIRIDYQHLNAACPNDEFSLPNMDIMIDSTSGKFLGFLVHQHNIDVDPERVRTIETLMPLINVKELKSLMGKLSYIWHFILGLAAATGAFALLLRKGKEFVWTKNAPKAYERVQQLVTNLPTIKTHV